MFMHADMHTHMQTHTDSSNWNIKACEHEINKYKGTLKIQIFYKYKLQYVNSFDTYLIK